MLLPLNSRLRSGITQYAGRAAYEAATGKKAEPWDSSRPVKDWADTTVMNADVPVSYLGIRYDSNGNPFADAAGVITLRSFEFYPEIAQTVNLLPEPMPAQGELTPTQLRMSQRKEPLPLALKEGEKVVYSPGLRVPVIDDGKADPSAPAAGGFSQADRANLEFLVQAVKDLKANFPAPPRQ